MSMEQKAALAKSRQIDLILQEDGDRMRRDVKLLLLGESGSRPRSLRRVLEH